MKYPVCYLSDVAEIFSGFAFRSQDMGNYGIPVIKIANIQDNQVIRECSDYFPEYLLSRKLDRYFLQDRDCLVAMTGAGSVGKFGKMHGARGSSYLINQRVGIIRPDWGLCDPTFVSHVLSNGIYRDTLFSLGLGAGQPNVSAKEIGSLEIPNPPLPTQRKIAAILSAYDDLIENNLRRIKILEEMAQNLYREWFVKFRFPGHQDARFVDSALGRIPEGWEVKTINDVVKICSGFAFKSKTFVTAGKYKVVTIKHVKDGLFIDESESQIDTPPSNMPKHCHLHTGDILLSLTGNVGRTCLVFGHDFLLNQRVAKLVPHASESRGFVYFMFRSVDMKQRLEMISTGVAQQNLSPVQMGKIEIAVPREPELTAFSQIAEPICDSIISLNLRNHALRRTRDLLLPKLISGAVDVSALDIAISEEVQA